MTQEQKDLITKWIKACDESYFSARLPRFPVAEAIEECLHEHEALEAELASLRNREERQKQLDIGKHKKADPAEKKAKP